MCEEERLEGNMKLPSRSRMEELELGILAQGKVLVCCECDNPWFP
jgi:hypothetical protein